MVGKILAVWLVGVGMAVGQTATAPVAASVPEATGAAVAASESVSSEIVCKRIGSHVVMSRW